VQHNRLSGARALFIAIHFHLYRQKYPRIFRNAPISQHNTDPAVMSDRHFEVIYPTKPYAERNSAHTNFSNKHRLWSELFFFLLGDNEVGPKNRGSNPPTEGGAKKKSGGF